MSKKSKNKLRNDSAIFIVALVGILIFVNILSTKLFARGDLTENNLFTLSQASIDLVKSLDDKLLVKAYFTKNLPGRYATLERQVQDLLEEYAQYSGGNMKIEFIDPAGDEEEEKIAQSLGINKMPNPDIEKDQATVKEGYRGISFAFGENREVIRAVETPVGLEYDVTTILKKLLGKKSVVAFTAGHGEPEIDPPKDPAQMRQMPPNPRDAQGAFMTVRKNLDIYNYRQQQMAGKIADLPENTRAMVVAGPTKEFKDEDLYVIDQFLMNGGSLAVFVDGVSVSEQPGQFQGMPSTYVSTVNKSNFLDFLKHYGIQVENKLVMDAQASNTVARCAPIPIPIPKPYPAWPMITAFGEDHPVTFGVGALTMPYASVVRVTKEAQKDKNITAQNLAYSSGNAWTTGEGAEMDPCTMKVPEELESSLPMVAAVTGTFTSYFKGKEIPKEASDNPKEKGFIETSKSPGRIIVVGSSGLPADDKLQTLSRINRRQVMFNFAFVQNVLDWLTNEEDLIAVRMKNVADPPIEKELSEGTKAMAKWGNIIGVPLAFMLFGVVRWRLRRVPAKNGRRESDKASSDSGGDRKSADKA
jgi:ABC-type uncharacterized transport system involved in gliding motility auxiliary subunit